MSQWRRILGYMLCISAIGVHMAQGFRLRSQFLDCTKPFHKTFAVQADESEKLDYDAYSSYIDVQQPVKAIWDLISESLVPQSLLIEQKQEPEALPILLSCSGGVDSMSMLHALGIIKRHAAVFVKNSGWRRIFESKGEVDQKLIFSTVKTLLENVHVIYFDHKVRTDTDKDIELIARTSETYGFKLILETANETLSDLADDRTPGNFQNCAREWRRGSYKRIVKTLGRLSIDQSRGGFFLEELGSTKLSNRYALNQVSESSLDRDLFKNYFSRSLAGIVLLGHHANDDVETFMFKLLRGVHLSNITGIEPMTYLDKDKDVVLVRPFSRLTKEELRFFLEQCGGQHHEDSSNNSPKYLRNRVRTEVIPGIIRAMYPAESGNLALKSLYRRCRNLSSQSNALKESIDLETYMFNHYVSSKYGLPNYTEVPQCQLLSTSKVPLSRMENVYSDFYKTMYNIQYGHNEGDKTQKYLRTVQFLRAIGFNLRELLFVKEWSLVTSDLVRKDILYKYCLRATGSDTFLDYAVIENLSNLLTKEPFTEAMKTYCLRKDISIRHQGALVKTQMAPPPISSGTVVYDDGQCSFRVSSNFVASVAPFDASPVPRGFYLRLSVPTEGSDGRTAAFDIRQLKEDDVLPSDALWNRTASSVLSKMAFPQILMDELPVIALRDTNHVVCFYGINASPPYYLTSPQFASLSFAKHASQTDEYRDYQITLKRT